MKTMDSAEVVSARTLNRVLELEAARWEVKGSETGMGGNLYGYDVTPLCYALWLVDAHNYSVGVA
jgi:hypothetical protein